MRYSLDYDTYRDGLVRLERSAVQRTSASYLRPACQGRAGDLEASRIVTAGMCCTPAVLERVGVHPSARKLLQFAWPGGYEVFYLSRDMDVFCARCTMQRDEPSDPLIAADAECNLDSQIECCECGRQFGPEEDA